MGAEPVSLDTNRRRDMHASAAGRHRGLLHPVSSGKCLASAIWCVPQVYGHVAPVALEVERHTDARESVPVTN